MDRQRILDIIHGKDDSIAAQFIRLGLHAAQPFYRLAVYSRNSVFDLGLRKPARLPRPVISVGNITTGGTGKTPLVIDLARRLANMGHTPAILLRGYRGSDQQAGRRGKDAPTLETRAITSDEANAMRNELGHAVEIEANPNRVAGAQAVLKRRPDVGVFLLDDGFQHRQVARDLNLALIDATFPFGGQQMLPAGLLREPIRALRRADAVILTHADLVNLEQVAAIFAVLQRHGCPLPTIRVAHAWAGFVDATQQTHPLESLRGLKVAGVCGIGNPRQFKAMLARHFNQVTSLYELDDHQSYTPALVRQMVEHAAQQGAKALVTTEKDWVKWKPLAAQATTTPAMPLYRPVLKLAYLEGEEKLEALLRKTLHPPQA